MSVFYELAAGVASLIRSIAEDDLLSLTIHSKNMRDKVKRMDDKQPYSPFYINIVFADLLKLPLDTAQDLELQTTVLKRISEIYGENHLLLGDLYFILSDLLQRKQHCREALDLAGQALLIRVNTYGIVDDRTAESHIALGMLYRRLGHYDKSRQELYIGRGIRSKLHGDSSVQVAQCDLQIGYTELAYASSNLPSNGNLTLSSSSSLNNAKAARSSAIAAYAAFYRCFQCRYIALGAGDPLTLEAEELLMTHNIINGERIVSAMELKLRIHELQWSCSGTTSWLYSVALFVGRLCDDEALTMVQLKQLVSSAIRFSISRLSSVGAPENGNGTNSSPARERPTVGSPTTRSQLAGLNAPSSEEPASAAPGTDALAAPVDSQQEQINVITSMLMMIPKPFVVTAHSPGKRSGAASPTKASHAEQRGLPKLRIPGQSNNSANNSALNSPEAADRPPIPMWTLRQSVLRDATSNPTTESKTSTEFGEPNQESSALPEPVTPNKDSIENKPQESPSKFQLKSKVIDGETASPGPAANTSPARNLPASWKPIRSAYHSLAWSACNTIQNVDFAIGSAEAVYARDKEGVLLVLRRAAGNTIEEAQKNEKKQQLTQRKSIRKSSTATSGATQTAVGGGPTKRKSIEAKTDEAADGKAKLGALFAKRAPPPAAASEGGGNVDPKAALNALFSKQGGGLGLKLGGPPPGGPAAATASAGAAKAGAGPVWGKDIPMPPPIPTSWPPEPYVSEAGSGGASGEAGAGTPAGAATATSTIVNADGTVIAINIPVPAGPPKAKLKQIYLVGLPSVEGTMWAEEGEALISPEELFDDLEAEFTLEKPKAVKKNSEVPFGGGAAGLKATPGLGGGKKDADEAVLDAQRAQNINIMLAKFGKKSYFDLAQAVRAFEVEAVGAASVAALSQFLPTIEEASKVTAFVLKKAGQAKQLLEDQRRKEQTMMAGSGDAAEEDTVGADKASAPGDKKAGKPKLPVVTVAEIDEKTLNKLKLGKAEQYIFVFAQVQKLETRLSAMTSVLSIKETSQNILSSAEVTLNAVNEVRGSGRLKFLLKAFLDLNNSLCKAAKASDKVTGIKLESLSKITQTKSNSGETAEQYVVNKVLQHFPDALKVHTDMPSIEAAKGVIFPRMVAELRKLEEGISMMKSLIEFDTAQAKLKPADASTSEIGEESKPAEGEAADGTVAKASPPEEKTQIHACLARGEAIFAKASKQLHDAQRDFAELCTYLGEDVSGDPERIFGQIITFVKGIQAATVLAEGKAKKKAAPPSLVMARPQIKLPNMIH